MGFPHRLLLTATALCALAGTARAEGPDGLLFSLSGEHGLNAETAGGQAGPIFATRVDETDGVVGKGQKDKGLHFNPGLSLAWSAPGNIYARRGTVSFWFRAAFLLSSITPDGISSSFPFLSTSVMSTAAPRLWLDVPAGAT